MDRDLAALRGAGWEALEVPPAEDCPDAVFVEDTMVLHRGTAVIARPGAESRRAETEGAEAAIARLGYRVARIEEPGTLDGGDVLDAGDRLYVGTGGRTSSEGARQLGALVGTPVVEIPIEGLLHLKTAVTALPDGTFAGFAPHVPDPASSRAFAPCPSPPAQTWLCSAGARSSSPPTARAAPSSTRGWGSSRSWSTSRSCRSSRPA